jgi:hypothetical protein
MIACSVSNLIFGFCECDFDVKEFKTIHMLGIG